MLVTALLISVVVNLAFAIRASDSRYWPYYNAKAKKAVETRALEIRKLRGLD